jgi:hypothetical protein
MDFATIIADAMSVLQLGQIAVSVAQDAAPFVAQATSILQTGTALTDAERAALATQEASLRAMLNAQSIPADAS